MGLRGPRSLTGRSDVGGRLAAAGPLVQLRADAAVRTVPLAALRCEHFVGSSPWRRFRSRQGQQHLSGEYWAATTAGHVVFESQLELARLMLADFDVDVAAIYAQPFRLTATVEGVTRSHVPDFLLVSVGGTATVVNVKPAGRLADAAVAAALAWPEALVIGHGWRWEVWSGCDPVLLDNVRFLAGYRRPWVVAADEVRKACEAVGEGTRLSVVERRLAGAAPAHTVRPAVLAALWHGRLVTDLTELLSGESMVWRP